VIRVMRILAVIETSETVCSVLELQLFLTNFRS
jgi:hypothetical protein